MVSPKMNGGDYVFVVALFLTILGFVMLFRPTLFWEITESWKSNDGTEPSDLYIFSTRFGGVMFTIAGILGFIACFL
jgi:hypothetical protein